MFTKQQLDGPWELCYFDGHIEKAPNRGEANNRLRKRLAQWMEDGDTIRFYASSHKGKAGTLAEVVASDGEGTDATVLLLPAKRAGSHFTD